MPLSRKSGQFAHPVPRKQRGVSLIESLVALLVLALGVLGLAGLQTRTLTETRLTNARAAAVRMVEDLNERIQLNTEARLLPASPYITAWGPVAAAPNCVTAACTAQQLAQYDISQWKASLNALLPGGDATVFQSPADPSQFGVLVGWNDNQSVAAVDDAAAYSAPFVIDTGVPGVGCQAGQICHLVHIRP